MKSVGRIWKSGHRIDGGGVNSLRPYASLRVPQELIDCYCSIPFHLDFLSTFPLFAFPFSTQPHCSFFPSYTDCAMYFPSFVIVFFSFYDDLTCLSSFYSKTRSRNIFFLSIFLHKSKVLECLGSQAVNVLVWLGEI